LQPPGVCCTFCRSSRSVLHVCHTSCLLSIFRALPSCMLRHVAHLCVPMSALRRCIYHRLRGARPRGVVLMRFGTHPPTHIHHGSCIMGLHPTHPTHRCFLCAHEVATRPRRERTGKRVACCPARLHAPPLRVILQPPRVILHLFISCSCVLCFALFLCVWALFCLLGLCPPRGQDRRRRPPKAVR
jgi:hypothetical protein